MFVLSYFNEGEGGPWRTSDTKEKCVSCVKEFLTENLGYEEDDEYVKDVVESLENDNYYDGGEDEWVIDECISL